MIFVIYCSTILFFLYFCATMPPVRRNRHVEVDEDHEDFDDDTDEMSEEDEFEEGGGDATQRQRDEEMLDDDDVFAMFKKVVCTLDL